MRSLAFTLALLLVSATAAAAPSVTGVSPATGPSIGGTFVTISGTDFQTCEICSPPIPPRVYFGDEQSPVALMYSSEMIVAITPPHASGTVNVRVEVYNGTSTLANAFTYTGVSLEATHERLLLPIFTAPVFGAYGSEFRSELSAFNSGFGDLPILGIDAPCQTPCPPFTGAYLLPPDTHAVGIIPNGNPGRFIYVPRNAREDLALNLRVYDRSRSDLNFGTEMPIARETDFRDVRVAFASVPIGQRFRTALRIYATGATSVVVTVNGKATTVVLEKGENMFEPAYAMFTDFPYDLSLPPVTQFTTVTVDAPTIIVLPPAPLPKIWAFITVTNNETQQITTITPQ